MTYASSRLDFGPLMAALQNLNQSIETLKELAEPVTYDELDVPRRNPATGSTHKASARLAKEGRRQKRLVHLSSGLSVHAPGVELKATPGAVFSEGDE